MIFDNLPVKISNPINIKNGYMSFDDPKMATIVGLLLYSLETNRNFELDSNKNLIRKIKNVEQAATKAQPEEFAESIRAADIQKTVLNNKNKDVSEEDDSKLLPTLTKKDKNTGVKKLWNAITEWF